MGKQSGRDDEAKGIGRWMKETVVLVNGKINNKIDNIEMGGITRVHFSPEL